GAFDVESSAIAHNVVSGTGPGGAVYHTGSGALILRNGTIAENTGGNTPGGVVLAASVADTLVNDTVADNTGTGADALAVVGANSPSPSVGNTALSSANLLNCSGKALADLGHNIENADTCKLTGPGDTVNTD